MITVVMIYYVGRNVGLERKLQKKQEETKSDRKRFTEELCKILLATLGEEYQTELTVTRKNNGVMKEVLYVRKKGCECMPCFYTDELYRSYCDGENEVGLAEHMVNIVLNECEIVRREVQRYLTKEWIAEHLFLRMVQIEQNREWLEDAVYVNYLDLAAVVYVLTEDNETGVKSFLLPKSAWDTLQVGTPEDYFPKLVENTAQLFSEKLWGIETNAAEGDCYSVFKLTEASKEELREERLYVLSNHRKINGAAVMLYPGLLEEMYEGFSGNFFIIPSSVHEVLLIKETGDQDEEFLNRMVKEVNESQVEPEEVLSDHVYYYSAEHRLCMSRTEE